MTASIPPGPIWAAELLTMTMALILVLLFLLLIPIIVWRFLSRRREGQDRAARALVVAAVFLLTAAWCYFLSPTIPWDVRGAGSPLQIEGLASAEQVFFVKEEGRTVEIVLRPFEEPIRFDVRLLDPDGKLIWQRQNTTWATTEFEAPETGMYTVEVKNLEEEQGRIFYGYEIKEYLRPAAVLAPWLALVSLPVLAYGIWTAIRRPPHA